MIVMKSQKHLIRHRKQSRIGSPVKNLWFYNESTGDSFTTSSKSIYRNNSLDQINTDANMISTEKKKPSMAKANTFVVDWQISDFV